MAKKGLAKILAADIKRENNNNLSSFIIYT